ADEGRGRRPVAREVAAVDDEDGPELPHPVERVAVAARPVPDLEHVVRRVDAGEQDAVDLGAGGDDRHLAGLEALIEALPREGAGLGLWWMRLQRESDGWREPLVVGFGRAPDQEVAARDDAQSIAA